MPDDTPDYRHGLDDPDDDTPEFLRTDGSGKVPASDKGKQSEPGANSKSGAKSAPPQPDSGGKVDTRVYVWMGEEDVHADEEPEEEHEIEPEFSPDKGQFDLSGNPLGKDNSWQAEGGRVSRDNRDLIAPSDQFDLAGNPIPVSARPAAADDAVVFDPLEVTHTPPPEDYVWEGDMDVEEKPEPSKKSAPAKAAKPKIVPVGKEGPVELGVGIPTARGGRKKQEEARKPAPGRQPAAGRRGKVEKGVKERPKFKPNRGLLIGFGLAVLVMGGALFLFLKHATRSDIVPFPDAITKFTSPDKNFSGFRPSGWTLGPPSVAGYPGNGFSFTSGTTQMIVTGQSAVKGSTLDSLYIADGKFVAQKFPGYTEKAGNTYPNTTGGEERIAEWTTPGDFFHEKMHGYRMTMLDSGYYVLMVCVCPDQSWTGLKPAFVSFINKVQMN